MGYLLTMIALILLSVFTPLAIIYSAIKFAINRNLKGWYELNDKYNFNIALGLDRLGNVIFQELFNDIFITRNATVIFGTKGETVSYVLSESYFGNTLTRAGKVLVNILEWLDEGHMENSKP